MVALELTDALGLETIGKRALHMLKNSFNAKLDVIMARMALLDNELGYRPIEVERIEEKNFYYGHRPSLIDAPKELYPNCSVMAYTSQPAVEGDALDHVDVFDVALFVELMCKSDNEYEVNARITRTVEAAHAVLLDDPTLGGCVVDVGNQPSVFLTDVFARPETDGGRFVWQGARMEYRPRKYVDRW